MLGCQNEKRSPFNKINVPTILAYDFGTRLEMGGMCITICTPNKMLYSTNGLSIEGVQRILAERVQEKTELEHRRYNLDYATTSALAYKTELESELVEVTNIINQLNEEIAAMPVGSARKAKEIQQSKQITRKLNIEDRLSKDDGESLPEREHDLAIIILKIQEKEAYITALQARLTELNG